MQKSLLYALQLASHLAYMVVIPLLIFGGLGLALDQRYGTIPSFLLVGIGLAFVSTVFWIKRSIKEIVEAMNKAMNKEN
jgi:F0F1-type ATP synthase assembly protein I